MGEPAEPTWTFFWLGGSCYLGSELEKLFQYAYGRVRNGLTADRTRSRSYFIGVCVSSLLFCVFISPFIIHF